MRKTLKERANFVICLHCKHTADNNNKPNLKIYFNNTLTTLIYLILIFSSL